MGWTTVELAVCGLYDVYAVQLALRNGRHPAPMAYGFYVPSAEMLTGVTIMQVYFQKVILLPDILVFAIALPLLVVAVITVIVAGLAHRHSLPWQ